MDGTEHSFYRTVLVYAGSGTAAFAPELAARLKREHGARIVLVVNTEQDRVFFARKHPGLADAIETSNFQYRSLLDPIDDGATWIAEAADFERRYGFRFLHLLVDDRHMGLGFSAGGTRYPTTGWAKAATFEKSVRALVLQLRFVEGLLSRHAVTLAINPTKIFCVIARARGIPVRYFANTAFRSYFTWTSNEFMESPLLRGAFARTNADPGPELVHHHDNYLQARTAALRRMRLPSMLRSAAVDVIRYVYWSIRRYEKRLGYRLWEELSGYRRIWADYRALRRQRLWRAAELDGRRIVYYPLAVEPEITMTRESPEFCHQAFAIHALAKDLPPDAVLAVKEHLFSIGTRPQAFYRDLAKIPNLRLIDPLEWGLDVIRRSAAVATINGTSGFEAAVLGKPVVVFGVHCKYDVIPHVRIVRGWHDVAAAIDDALRLAASQHDTRLRDGQRFLNALVQISVDCTGISLRRPIPDALMTEIVALLHRSVVEPLGAAPPAIA